MQRKNRTFWNWWKGSPLGGIYLTTVEQTTLIHGRHWHNLHQCWHIYIQRLDNRLLRDGQPSPWSVAHCWQIRLSQTQKSDNIHVVILLRSPNFYAVFSCTKYCFPFFSHHLLNMYIWLSVKISAYWFLNDQWIWQISDLSINSRLRHFPADSSNVDHFLAIP